MVDINKLMATVAETSEAIDVMRKDLDAYKQASEERLYIVLTMAIKAIEYLRDGGEVVVGATDPDSVLRRFRKMREELNVVT